MSLGSHRACQLHADIPRAGNIAVVKPAVVQKLIFEFERTLFIIKYVYTFKRLLSVKLRRQSAGYKLNGVFLRGNRICNSYKMTAKILCRVRKLFAGMLNMPCIQKCFGLVVIDGGAVKMPAGAFISGTEAYPSEKICTVP